MRVFWGILGLLLLALPALPARADTIYDISGTATLEGTNCPSCSENFTFSMQVDETTYPGFGFAYLVPLTSQVTATGPIPPDTWSMGFALGFFFEPPVPPGLNGDNGSWQHMAMGDLGGDDIEMIVFTPGLDQPPVISQGMEMWSCGTLQSCSDFGRVGQPPQADEFGYVSGGPADITVTELTPEPQTWALLWIGLIGLALMKFAPRGKRFKPSLPLVLCPTAQPGHL